jgi:hypothetical protein
MRHAMRSDKDVEDLSEEIVTSLHKLDPHWVVGLPTLNLWIIKVLMSTKSHIIRYKISDSREL